MDHKTQKRAADLEGRMVRSTGQREIGQDKSKCLECARPFLSASRSRVSGTGRLEVSLWLRLSREIIATLVSCWEWVHSKHDHIGLDACQP